MAFKIASTIRSTSTETWRISNQAFNFKLSNLTYDSINVALWMILFSSYFSTLCMPPKQKFRPLRKPIRRPKGGGKAKLGKKYTFYSNYSPKANLFSERIRIILFTCNGGSKSSVSLLMSTAVEAVVATGDEGEEESTLRLELTTESCRTWKKKASLVMRWGCQLACPTFKCQLVQKMGEWKWWLLSTLSSTQINILSSTYMIGTGCANKYRRVPILIPIPILINARTV